MTALIVIAYLLVSFVTAMAALPSLAAEFDDEEPDTDDYIAAMFLGLFWPLTIPVVIGIRLMRRAWEFLRPTREHDEEER